jgi:hypothetical protein
MLWGGSGEAESLAGRCSGYSCSCSTAGECLLCSRPPRRVACHDLRTLLSLLPLLLQEVKLGDMQRIRGLFERSTRLSLPPKKMKGLFKRWLAWEGEAGGEAGVEHVKKRAMEFVEGSMRG